MNRNRLLVAFGITFLMMVVEFAGGLLSGSIALISDAAHMLVDTLALGASALAAHFAAKESAKKIGGYYVGEVHAALGNGVILCGVAIFIIYSAVNRFFNPREVQSVLMTAVAVVGLGANLIGIFLLREGSRKNINVRGAFLHIVSDTLSSAGVIIGGAIIYFTGWYLIDSILGFLISLMILRGGIGLIKDAAKVLIKKG
ncbi:MAG: cation diffusion facilitator family transporter [bacterium]|nr:cation diffusion facilitator family transporter [bacterium]